MSKFEKKFKLKDNLSVITKNIEIDKFRRENLKKSKFIPIQNNAFWEVRIGGIELAKIYSALTYLVGYGDNNYDSYKGSYSFWFELEVSKNNKTSRYLYHMYHFRSYMEFLIYQIADLDDQRDPNSYNPPQDDLFSDADICFFSNYFCGFFIGFTEGITKTGTIKPNPFMKSSQSNLMLFGYKDGQYFCNNYDIYEDFEKAYNSLKELETVEIWKKTKKV